jgi:hypothetical protein
METKSDHKPTDPETMAAVLQLNDAPISPAQAALVKTFAVWLAVARQYPEKYLIKGRTNIMLEFSDEDGNHIGSNCQLKNHPRREDIDECLNKGMKLLMSDGTMDFRTQTLKNGINVVRFFYDDRRRGLTGGINFMMTKEWMDLGGTKMDAAHYPHNYTLLINIRERKTQKCRHPDCQEVSNQFQPCSGCMNVVYCSEECHRADWAAHKDTCKEKHTQNL